MSITQKSGKKTVSGRALIKALRPHVDKGNSARKTNKGLVLSHKVE